MSFAMIAQRVFNTPLMVDPIKGHAFLTGLGGRLTGARLVLPRQDADQARAERAGRIEPRMSILGGDMAERYSSRGRRMYSVRDGIAIIEVTGTLVHRGDWIGESSGTTSYEGLAQQVEAAGADPSVRGIALEIDSFGGEVAGVFDLADSIRNVRALKPVWAFVAEAALSAAYALASQADRIILPRTGEVGSIGILIVHADYSQRLSDEGVRVTMIHAGAHKVEGNPYEPLPEDVREGLQAETETLRTLFAETVAAGRAGRMTAQAALGTEARVVRGERAVALGLADAVMDLRAGFASFSDHVHRRQSAASTIVANSVEQTKELAMTGSTSQTAADDAMQPTNTPADPVVTETQDPVVSLEDPAGDDSATAGAIDTSPDPASAAAPSSGKAADSLSRADAASLAEIGTQAARLGVKVDVAQAIRQGLSPDALRTRVLQAASDRDAASEIFVSTPSASAAPKESPVVAAAKRAAASAASRKTH